MRRGSEDSKSLLCVEMGEASALDMVSEKIGKLVGDGKKESKLKIMIMP